MSDTGDLSRTEEGQRIMCPAWLYGMGDDWWETYFDLSQTCAVATRWGHG